MFEIHTEGFSTVLVSGFGRGGVEELTDILISTFSALHHLVCSGGLLVLNVLWASHLS